MSPWVGRRRSITITRGGRNTGENKRTWTKNRDREIENLKAELASLETDYAALRESAHKQRGDLNKQVLKEVNDANDLRNRLWELTREVEELRQKSSGNNQPKGAV